MKSSRLLIVGLLSPLVFAATALFAQAVQEQPGEPAAREQSPAAEPQPVPEPAAPIDSNPAQPAPPPVAAAPVDPKSVTIRIATQGGAYAKSQNLAYFQPFTRRTGFNISAVRYDGTLAALEAQRSAPVWDIVDLPQYAAIRGCEQELLEPLDAAMLEAGPDGTTPQEDFLPGAIQPCAVASVAWSALIVFDKGMKTPPTKAEHFFDLKRYPGKRALPKTPQYTLEMALMADGVPPAGVYALLATREGQDRAFAKLASIKDQTVWWEKPQQPLDQVAQKQAAMALTFNGRAFLSVVQNRQGLGLLWDHQIYNLDYWAVPKGAQNAGPAKQFIAFATSTGPLADQTRWFPYGPARISAVRLAGKHAEVDLDMKPFLPTHQPNLQDALAFDGVWWASQEKPLKERFDAWMDGRDPPPAADPNTSQ